MPHYYPEEKCKECPLCGEMQPDFFFEDQYNPGQYNQICQCCMAKEHTPEEFDRLKQIAFTNFLMVTRAINDMPAILEEKEREKREREEEKRSDNNV